MRLRESRAQSNVLSAQKREGYSIVMTEEDDACSAGSDEAVDASEAQDEVLEVSEDGAW